MTRRWVVPVVLVAAALAGLLIAAALAPIQGWGRPATTGRSMMGGPGSGNAMMGGPGPGAPVMGGAGMMDGGSGRAMMGGYVLPGNGVRVDTLDAARQRAQAFADRWGLRVGEVMQFDNGFYVELQTTNGQAATEVLVDAAGMSGWNTGRR